MNFIAEANYHASSGAPNRLNVLVDGESLINDANAIVAFSILLAIAVEGTVVGFSDLDNIFIEFLRVFFGGVISGSLLGFVTCELLYRIHANISVILTASIIVGVFAPYRKHRAFMPCGY